MVDGDSSYNKRHKTGHCKALMIPHGALIEFIPTMPGATKPSAGFKGNTRKGLFLSYRTNPGEVWSGAYYVVEWETLRHKPSANPSQCRIHEVEEIFNFDPSNIRFPLAEYREELQLRVCSSDEESNPVTAAIPDVLPFPAVDNLD